MRLIIFGPHGSGKGTQAGMIASHYGMPRVSTGDIFRDIVKNPGRVGYIPSELVKAVRDFLDRKEYVSDGITNKIVESRLSEKDCAAGFILDGYPRTLPQMGFLDALLRGLGQRIDAVINLVVDEEELVKRQLYRVTCGNEKCGASYNTFFAPPKKEGVCDRCGSRLYRRSDDTEEGIRRRNREYEGKAKPLLEHYKKRGLVVDIVGTGRMPGDVFREIRAFLDRMMK